ncbi:MAG: hypothetical protein AAFX41_16615, partial [Bacteroidota bacterium]
STNLFIRAHRVRLSTPMGWLFHPLYFAALFGALCLFATLNRDAPTALLAGALVAYFVTRYRAEREHP